jgi:site-specific recombinase XerD
MATVRIRSAESASQSVRARRVRVPDAQSSAITVESITHAGTLPAVVHASGRPAAERFVEFFAATIRNRNTREAYARAIGQFLVYAESVGCADLASINTMVVSAYVERTFADRSAPTAKQHLAAIRRLFDWLVTGQIVTENPAAAVRGPSHIVREGKTPVLDGDEAKKLLASIDATTLVGLRDRALIAVMIYSFARVSAAVNLKVGDLVYTGRKVFIQLREKGGKARKLPCHHTAEEYLDAYLRAAGLSGDPKAIMFRSARRRADELTEKPMNRKDAWAMIRRRALAAGLSPGICCHTFRATGITAFMRNGGRLEVAQDIAGHADARTTKLYDRSRDRITLDEIERIAL